MAGVWLLVSLAAVAGCGRSEQTVLDAERAEKASPSASASGSSDGTPGATTSDDLVLLEDRRFPLTIEVPRDWSRTGVTDWAFTSDPTVEPGRLLVARPPEAVGGDGAVLLGVLVGTSDEFLRAFDVPTEDYGRFAVRWTELVAELSYEDDDPSCDYGGVSLVGKGSAHGLMRIWTQCGDGSLTLVDAWSADPDTGDVVYALVVVPGGRSLDMARAILGSLARDGEAVLDVDQS